MHSVVLVNGDCTPLCTISWQRAVKLMLRDKAHPFSNEFLEIKTISQTILVPKILRLLKIVKNIFKGKVKYCKKNVLLRDKYTCAYCGKNVVHGYTLDHVIPRCAGGKDVFENVVACCRPCNISKGNLSLDKCGLILKLFPHEPSVSELIKNRLEMQGAMATLDKYYKSVL